MQQRRLWPQFLLFKAGWLALVLAGNWAVPLIAPLLIWLLYRLNPAERRGFGLLLVLGIALDSALSAGGLFSFSGATDEYQWLPLWLLVLWGWFAWCWVSTLQYWLPSPLLVLLFGCIGGPLAYQAGALLNPAALTIEADVWFWPLQATGWALLMLIWLQWRQQQNKT